MEQLLTPFLFTLFAAGNFAQCTVVTHVFMFISEETFIYNIHMARVGISFEPYSLHVLKSHTWKMQFTIGLFSQEMFVIVGKAQDRCY